MKLTAVRLFSALAKNISAKQPGRSWWAASESKGKSLTDADVLLMNSAVKGS